MRLTSDLTTPRVLVADEDHLVREQLCDRLRGLNYEVLEASDAEEALRIATSFPVDLAILDLALEPMRGDQLALWIGRQHAETIIVCTTSNRTFEAAQSMLRCGALDAFVKPYDLDEIEERVSNLIAARRNAPDTESAQQSPDQATDAGRTADLKRRFLSAVAHELRTPLTVIKTFVTVLERGAHGPVNTDQAEVLEHVQIEADRLAHEIDKLLSLARLESEDFSPDRAAVPVSVVLRPIEKRLRARAREVRVELLIRVDDPGLQVYADPQDISRVLLALTENALKFTAEGGRVVVHVVPEGNDVRFEVLDSGIGIDPRHHARIFEMFSQVENPLNRRYRGAGIGLSYAARIVEAHGARIEVRSLLGDGSSFSFLLPSALEADTQGITSASAGKIGLHA